MSSWRWFMSESAESLVIVDDGGAICERYRNEYGQRCRTLKFETRLNLAKTSGGEVLLALCFDPASTIIVAIISNPNANLVHARLIAAHHQTSAGLMALAKRPAFMADSIVQRGLLQNPLSSSATLSRFLASYNLFKLANTVNGHESTEKGRAQARQVLRDKMCLGTPEDVAHFIMQTEGRNLKVLGAETLSQETLDILCRERYTSEMLVTNLIAWPALPPRLIEHLLRQPIVRQNRQLRSKLLGHRHCPTALRR